MKKRITLFSVLLLIAFLFVSCGEIEPKDTYIIAVPGFGGAVSKSIHIGGIDGKEFVLPDAFTTFTDRNGTTVDKTFASVKMAGGILRTAPLVPVLETVSVDTSKKTLEDSFPSDFTSYGFNIKLEDWTAKANGIYFYYTIYEREDETTWKEEPSGVIHYFFDTKENKFWYREFLSYNFKGMGSGIIEISLDGISVDPEYCDYAVGIRKDGVFEKNASIELISLYDQNNDYQGTATKGCQIYSKIWITAAVNGSEYVSLFIPEGQVNYSPKDTSAKWINDDFNTALDAAKYYEENGDLSLGMMEKICQDVWGKQYGQENVVKMNKNFMNHKLQLPSIFSERLDKEWDSKQFTYMNSNAVVYNFKTKRGAIAMIGGGQETQKNFVYAAEPYKVFVSCGFKEWGVGLEESELAGKSSYEIAEIMCRKIYKAIYTACHFSEKDIEEAVELLLDKSV